MKPAPFDYLAPTSVAEAVDMLAERGDDAKVLAGGQSLVPMLALRLTRFSALVDLGHVGELAGIHENGSLVVGAMVRHHQLEEDAQVRARAPLLSEATPHIGHFQIRNRGTVGGSLAHADPAAEYPAVALALDATIHVAGPSGTRTMAAADFFLGTWTTALDSAEIVTGMEMTPWGPGSGFAVEEVARRHGDFAVAGVACGVQIQGARVARCAVALFGVDATPIRAHDAEQAVVDLAIGDVDPQEVANLAAAGLSPPDDIHATSSYRKRVAAVVTRRALARAMEAASRE
jgi:carbon-monoxide dehydrogenase medium subunit